jgi:RND family efflux transporter MFP subunit
MTLFNRDRRAFQVWVALMLLLGLLCPAPILAEEITISGFTEPYQDSTLGISVTGNVKKILVEEGERVKKGQAILELEQESEALEKERRRLLADSKAEVDAVARQLKTLGSHLKATRELYNSTGSVPREELENQELEYALAEVELQRLRDAEKREKIELDIASKQLNKRTLRASFAGEIAEIMIGIGENCELDTELVRLVNTSQGYFVANVELGITQQIEIGQEVELRFQTGLEPVKVKAIISFISPVVDPASGLRKIKAKFYNQDGIIVPGVAGVLIFQPKD